MDYKTQPCDGAVVARRTVNPSVLGSNPSREKPAGLNALAESVSQVYTGRLKIFSSYEGVGSNPTSARPRGHKHKGFIAQLGVRTTEDREVPRSIRGEAKRHRDRVVKVIHSRWIGRETAQVQILSVLLPSGHKTHRSCGAIG